MSQDTAVAEIKIGQPVAIQRSSSGWGEVQYDFVYKIDRITPSGQIVVRSENGSIRRFDNNGDEIGKYRQDTLRLNYDEIKNEVEERGRLREAAKAIKAVCVEVRNYDNWSKEALHAFVVELETKLATAKEKLALCASESPEQK